MAKKKTYKNVTTTIQKVAEKEVLYLIDGTTLSVKLFGENDLMTLRDASVWATTFLGKNVSMLNVLYLL